jgi:hypothetical protein
MPRPRNAFTADLFDVPEAPAPVGGSLDYCTELRYALSDALKKSPLSRHQIAARMSELTGHDIGKSMLDAWTAESKTPWRFPFEYAAAFEVASETIALQELLGRKRGSRILVGEETLLAELGKIHKQRDDLAVREKALKARIQRTRS